MPLAPDPHEAWQVLLPPAPRCPTCCYRMPTPAHVFLHQQQHSAPDVYLEDGRVPPLPLVLYDRVARLMQAYKEA
jgi:hypothetical protein